MGILIGLVFFVFGIFIIYTIFSNSFLMGCLVILIIIIGIYYFKKWADKNDEKQQDLKDRTLYDFEKGLSQFSISKKYVSDDLNTAFFFDETRKQICIASNRLTNSSILSFKDILEVEVIEDGNIITKTSRSSQIGGALLGGALAGGVGAIIGGLSGKSKSEQEVTKLELKIIVNNTQKPIYTIDFLDFCIAPVNKDGFTYKKAVEIANYWHGLISVLIHQADELDKKKQEKNASTDSQSVADELRKLSDLQKEGILTEEEYRKQKEILLKS